MLHAFGQIESGSAKSQRLAISEVHVRRAHNLCPFPRAVFGTFRFKISQLRNIHECWGGNRCEASYRQISGGLFRAHRNRSRHCNIRSAIRGETDLTRTWHTQSPLFSFRLTRIVRHSCVNSSINVDPDQTFQFCRLTNRRKSVANYGNGFVQYSARAATLCRPLTTKRFQSHEQAGHSRPRHGKERLAELSAITFHGCRPTMANEIYRKNNNI